MKVYPRFEMYSLFTAQKEMCAKCNLKMDVHSIEVDNILSGVLVCESCLKENTTSNTILPLRPSHYWKAAPPIPFEDFVFSREPLISSPDTRYVDEAFEEEEVDFPHERIKSSWHHRALLGDKNRQIYDDGCHTDFEALEVLEKMDEDSLIIEDQNTQFL